MQGIEQLWQVPLAHCVSSAVEKELLICPQDILVFHEFTSAKAHKYAPADLEPALNGALCTRDSHRQSTREPCGGLWLPGFGGAAVVSELPIVAVSLWKFVLSLLFFVPGKETGVGGGEEN